MRSCIWGGVSVVLPSWTRRCGRLGAGGRCPWCAAPRLGASLVVYSSSSVGGDVLRGLHPALTSSVFGVVDVVLRVSLGIIEDDRPENQPDPPAFARGGTTLSLSTAPKKNGVKIGKWVVDMFEFVLMWC